MKILLAGAGGLIGHALTGALEGAGHQLTRMVRSPGEVGPGTVSWDPADRRLDQGALEAAGPFDAVVNLAGTGIGDHRWTPARRQEILASRVASTDLLVAALRRLKPRPAVLVNASAVGYYGDRGNEVLTEDSAPGSNFLAEICVAWERSASVVSDELRVVLLRTGVVLTPKGGALAKQLPLFKLGLGGRLGGGRQFLSWITLEDEVAVILRALTDERLRGPVNATAPHPATNAEFTRQLGAALHRPTALVVPGFALSTVFGGQMAEEMLLGGQRVLPARLEAVGHTFAHPDLPGALAALLGPGR